MRGVYLTGVALALAFMGCGGPSDQPSPTPAAAPMIPAAAPTAASPTPLASAAAQPAADAVAPTPTGEPAEPPTEPAPVAASTGPAQLVLVHGHELLRSERRFVDDVMDACRRAGVSLEVQPAGDRSDALMAWMSELQPEVRSQMPLHLARGAARAVVVLWIPPPIDGRAQGIAGWGVIAGDPARERLWVRGGVYAGDLATVAAAFVGDAS